MGDEQDAEVARAPTLVDQFAHDGLVGQIKRQERLVAQQQARVPGQGLADAKPLLFTARKVREGLVTVTLRVDVVDELSMAARRALLGSGFPQRCPSTPSR